VLAFFLLAALTRADTDTGHGLLWEIGKPGQSPSHLFATIHSDDPGVLDLPGEVATVFEASGSVITELLMDADATVYLGQAMLLQDGQLLSELAGSALFTKTAAAMATRGIPERVLERMKPWAAAVTLSVPPSRPGQDVLDVMLYQLALDAGKPVYGLETADEQLGVFDAMPVSDQLLMLEDAVAGFDRLEPMLAEMILAWKKRDLAEILAISESAVKDSDPGFAKGLMQRVIDDRNVRMAERMLPHLDRGGAFVAVGALHLPGEAGLLRLLQKKGYSVRAVY
jgi:uncharacterized protein YbaP (TraB family)